MSKEIKCELYIHLKPQLQVAPHPRKDDHVPFVLHDAKYVVFLTAVLTTAKNYSYHEEKKVNPPFSKLFLGGR